MSQTREFIADTRDAATQTFHVDASAGGMITGAKGTIITIAPGAFRYGNGSIVQGMVAVRLIEAYTVGDMVALNMQTVARNGASRMALQSGGEVMLRAEAGGQQVTVAPGQAEIHFPADQPDEAMLAWVGEEDAERDILWDEPNELAIDSGLAFMDSMGGQGWIPGPFYNEPWPAGTFGDQWPPFDIINCDHPMPPGGDSTDVLITYPSTNSGTMVWLVFPSIDCMVYMESFQSNGVAAGFPVRIGLQGTVVALRIAEDGQYYSSFTPITVVDGHEQAITLNATSQSAYLAQLQSL